jgi:hypothetical protein
MLTGQRFEVDEQALRWFCNSYQRVKPMDFISA